MFDNLIPDTPPIVHRLDVNRQRKHDDILPCEQFFESLNNCLRVKKLISRSNSNRTRNPLV